MNRVKQRADTPHQAIPRRWAPHRWALWSQRQRVVAFLLVVESIALVTAIVVIVEAPAPGRDQWWRLGLLTLCAVVHLRASRRIERQRRDINLSPHIDLTSVWSVAAVLVLHPALILLLIGVLRVDRWFMARRPPFRFLFSATSHVLSAMVATTVLRQLSGQPVTAGWNGSAVAVGVVALTGAVYFAVQLVLISTVILLYSRNVTWSGVLGSGEANALEAATICMGCFAGLALAEAPLLLVAMVPVALVIHRTVLIRQLRAAANHDPKTGLLNPTGWRTRAEREITRAGRHRQPLGLLVIDLDHFKRVNDVYGHFAGDEVLRAIATVLTVQTREYDVVGRFGGEEFLVLLPGAGVDQTVQCGERLRESINSLAVPVEQSNAGTVVIDGLTASVGGCCYPDGAGTLEDLLIRADNALFAAKDAGRDRVCLVEDHPLQ